VTTDVLLVSLGSTHGWRVADDALAAALERAGARVATVRADRPPEVRTFALTDLAWARAARRAAQRGLAEHDPRVVLYSTPTAALLAPRRGAIRFDALAADNRPGRHGFWQRPAERRRIRRAPLLVPMSAQALAHAPAGAPPAVVVPAPIAPSGPIDGERDVDAIVYASDPVKKGLEQVLRAWSVARRPGEELVVVTEHRLPLAEGVRGVSVRGPAFRDLVRRARIYLVAPIREDFGIAQLEALADGCVLVTSPGLGPYPARDLARTLDPRLVTDDLARAVRVALDDPVPGYAERARALLAPYAPAAVDAVVADELVPALLSSTGS
jgi:hypothetical protein